MDFLPAFIAATSTISINPPGGTGHPSHPPHHHLPLPTNGFPSPVKHYVQSTHTGEMALWVVFVLFTLGLVGVFIMALRVERKARVFHWISALVLTTAMVSYFAMAGGLGYKFVEAPHHARDAGHVIILRQVYYARYIDWLFTTPLLLLSLCLLAGLSPADTLLTIFADIFMIVTGLLSTLVPARYAYGERVRWGFFAVSCVGFLLIFYCLATGGVKAAKHRPRKTRGLFTLLSIMTFLLWTAYPVVFGLSEGANKVSLDTEIVAYAVLDVAAKLGFTYMLLLIHTHGEDDTWILPEWFVEPRIGSGTDGRGGYGAIDRDD